MLSTRYENGFHQQKWIKNEKNVKKNAFYQIEKWFRLAKIDEK